MGEMKALFEGVRPDCYTFFECPGRDRVCTNRAGKEQGKSKNVTEPAWLESDERWAMLMPDGIRDRLDLVCDHRSSSSRKESPIERYNTE